MSDEELLEELRLLGQWLQGLGVGPRPADLSLLIGEATRKLSQAMALLFGWRGRKDHERAARN